MRKSRVSVHNPRLSVRNVVGSIRRATLLHSGSAVESTPGKGRPSHMTHSSGAPGPDGRAGPPLRVAVLGAGGIGHVHAEVVSSLTGIATLAAVVDSDAQTASRVAARHGTEALTSLAEVCARPDIDIVSICLPSGAHASAAIPVMRAGK